MLGILDPQVKKAEIVGKSTQVTEAHKKVILL